MGVDHEKTAAVHGHRLSTVVPAEPTGDAVVHELTDADLAVKLHYLRAVYYFGRSEAVDGLGITGLKEPMFSLLNLYYPVAGRVRRAEEEDGGGGGGRRPVVKCNDCGLRIIEASCGRSLEEWMAVEESERWRLLVPQKVLGPDLHFSPLVYVQFTRFKCGGLAIGYSWAHLLGDAVAATDCINFWGKLLSGNPTPKTLKTEQHHQKKAEVTAQHVKTPPQKPVPVKQVELAEDCWLAPNTCKMATHCFKIAETELEKLKQGKELHVPPFATISALIWRCLAKVRTGRESKLATICRSSRTSAKRGDMLSNKLKASTISLHSSAENVGTLELATLIHKHEDNELEMVDCDSGEADFVLYGANLTFVDMEGVELYGLELNGQKPLHVDYSIDGVGDEGAVLVFQDGKKAGSGGSSIQERTVVVILPEDQIPQLDKMLSNELSIA